MMCNGKLDFSETAGGLDTSRPDQDHIQSWQKKVEASDNAAHPTLSPWVNAKTISSPKM